ncbi:MAG: hypothetical protein M0R06_01175 [Sphaerochaeta sp.]|jgi:hypothetical protein|nr:hypothetical protein [Sphaerochaeta sp.]
MSGMLTPTIIAKEALIALENELVLANLVHRTYSKEFQSRGATILARKPSVYTATVVSNTVNAATVAESSVAIVLNRLADVTLSITSQDLSLEVVDFSEQFIQPAMRAHAQLMDLYGANEAVNFAGHSTVTGTPAAADIVQIGAVLDAQKCPARGRNLVMGPITKAGYMVLEPFMYAEHRADGGQAIREAEMGRVLGFDCYMDQNVGITHTSGAMADLAGAMKGAGAVGDGTATIDAITSGGTVLAGDVFKITGYDQWFRVAANATASAATVIVTFTPTLAQTVADDAVVTFQGTGRDNMAFHKNALALVTAPLVPPLGGAKAEVITYKNLSCRVVYDYNIMTKTNIMSIDMLYGWKTLDIALGARLIDQRSV